MKNLLIFGGTVEEHQLIRKLENDNKITLCVTTEYAEKLVENYSNNVCISVGKKNLDEIIEFVNNNNFDFIIDATHPYAKIITENLKKASEITNTKILRLIREKSNIEGCIEVKSINEAAQYLQNTKGNIMLTTGSKELKPFANILDFEQRMYPRVLPTTESIDICTSLGFKQSHIIAMQGPFSAELNVAFFRQYDIKIIVTKDGGVAGGFMEKIEAAKQVNADVVVISRNDEQGYNLNEILSLILKEV